jgi:hypothetical protein
MSMAQEMKDFLSAFSAGQKIMRGFDERKYMQLRSKYLELQIKNYPDEIKWKRMLREQQLQEHQMRMKVDQKRMDYYDRMTPGAKPNAPVDDAIDNDPAAKTPGPGSNAGDTDDGATPGKQSALDVGGDATDMSARSKPDALGTQSRAGYAYNYFLDKGYSPVQASGIVGGLYGETDNLNTTQKHDMGQVRSGYGLGIAGWNDDRLQGLKEYAAKNGGDIYNLDTQLGYVDHELRTTESGAMSRLQAAKTPAQAGQAMLSYFRPAGWDQPGAHPERAQNAERFYKQFGGRYDVASNSSAIPVPDNKPKQGVPVPSTDAPLAYTDDKSKNPLNDPKYDPSDSTTPDADGATASIDGNQDFSNLPGNDGAGFDLASGFSDSAPEVTGTSFDTESPAGIDFGGAAFAARGGLIQRFAEGGLVGKHRKPRTPDDIWRQQVEEGRTDLGSIEAQEDDDRHRSAEEIWRKQVDEGRTDLDSIEAQKAQRFAQGGSVEAINPYYDGPGSLNYGSEGPSGSQGMPDAPAAAPKQAIPTGDADTQDAPVTPQGNDEGDSQGPGFSLIAMRDAVAAGVGVQQKQTGQAQPDSGATPKRAIDVGGDDDATDMSAASRKPTQAIGGVETPAAPRARANSRFGTNYGGEIPELTGDDMMKIKQHVDPDGKMSDAQRNMAAYSFMQEYYIRKGDPASMRAAARLSASMLNYNKQLWNHWMPIANAAAEAGDLQGAATALGKAYSQIPNGTELKFAPAEGGNAINYQIVRVADGKPIHQGTMTTQQIAAMSAKWGGPGAFDRLVQESLKGPAAPDQTVGKPATMGDLRSADRMLENGGQDVTQQQGTDGKPSSIFPAGSESEGRFVARDLLVNSVKGGNAVSAGMAAKTAAALFDPGAKMQITPQEDGSAVVYAPGSRVPMRLSRNAFLQVMAIRGQQRDKVEQQSNADMTKQGLGNDDYGTPQEVDDAIALSRPALNTQASKARYGRARRGFATQDQEQAGQ